MSISKQEQNVNCPAWCPMDHAAIAGMDADTGLREHRLQVGQVETGREPATVDVTSFDDLGAGTASTARVEVWGADGGMTPAAARLLAALLLDAADIAQRRHGQVEPGSIVPSSEIAPLAGLVDQLGHARPRSDLVARHERAERANVARGRAACLPADRGDERRCAMISDLPVCGQPAADRIEVYSPAGGSAHGSMDGSVYTCAEHTAPVRAAMDAAGFTPYTVPGTDPGPKRCGDGYDFLAGRPLSAPTPGGAR